jgi:hypothetical protein
MVRESMGWRFPLRPRVTPLAARDKVEGLKASGAPRSPRSYAATRDRSRRSRSPTFEEERIFVECDCTNTDCTDKQDSFITVTRLVF